MKKLAFLLLTGMLLFSQYGHAQQHKEWVEDFDGSQVGFTSTTQNSWLPNTKYYLPSLTGATVSKSYLGLVPNKIGDTTVLTLTVPLDFSDYSKVQLRFSHICKIASTDVAKIQCKIGQQSQWESINTDKYLGSSENYGLYGGFNAASYSQWQNGNITAIPTQAWWEEEIFDLTAQLGGQTGVQIRFLIIHGNTPYTQASYGWLLENVRLTATTDELNPPKVEFIGLYPNDTVYSVGPYEINAHVKATGSTLIKQPWLKYTVTEPNKQAVHDSLLMTHIEGDSLWKAILPQYVIGTTVEYSITGSDEAGNEATASSWYVISAPLAGSAMDNVNFGVYDANSAWNTVVDAVLSEKMNSWSRSLYLNSELENLNASPALLTSIAYQMDRYSSTTPRADIRIYMRATNQTENPTTYSNPVADGATLVYQGPMNLVTTPNWIILPFTEGAFFLPKGSNLIVYVEDNSSTNSDYNNWQIEHSKIGRWDLTIYGATRGVGDAAASTAKPITRFGREVIAYGDNSVGLYSLDMPDTVAVSPTSKLPVVVTIKNVGALDLDSLTISYRINNTDPISKKLYFNPGLPWDFNFQDTLGDYSPKVNGFDTITAWVSLLHGQDIVTLDDILTKRVYGTTDLLVNFVSTPADTVYRAIPYEITARTFTFSGTPVNQVELDITYTYQGNITNDLLTMNLDTEDDLWKVTIPSQRFGTDVSYSIELTDMLDNTITISDSYYIKRQCGTGGCDTNSVAMESINSPLQTGISAGTPVPIHVTIRNRGVADLDSCYLNWSLNGVTQPNTAVYRGPLPDDFTDTITIEIYFSTADRLDTITVWVSMPNAHVDSRTDDDTLSLYPSGCGLGYAGPYRVGSGEQFSTLNAALGIIRNCGLSGDIELQLKGEYPENVNLSNISDYTNGHTLTITSFDNHADSAVLMIATGAGITFNNSNNIILKAITVDATTATNALLFTGACKNIMIRDCKLLTSPTTTSSFPYPPTTTISKGYGTGTVDSISFINNLIDGGYNSIEFIAASTIENCGVVRFDSNIVSNGYAMGAELVFADFISCSYNTVLTRTGTTNQSFQGFYIRLSSGPIVGNRFIQRSTSIINPSMLSVESHNDNTSGSDGNRIQGLIANNEIITFSNELDNYYFSNGAMHIGYKSTVDVLNNSIYVGGSGQRKGIHLESLAGDLNVKNNNIVTTGTLSTPIYCNSSSALFRWTFDNNNMHAPTYVAIMGNTYTKMEDWKQLTSDSNSVRVFPDFVALPVFPDSTAANHLNLTQAMGLTCPMISPVVVDIRDTARRAVTTIGCYEVPPAKGNGMLIEITGLTDGSAAGQMENVYATIYNAGETPLTSVNLSWSVNGTEQGNGMDYQVSLLRGDDTTIHIGSITYLPGNTVVKVWINNLNDNTLPDNNPEDDTLSRFIIVCPVDGYSGLLTVGQGGMFPNIQTVYSALDMCGISGEITMALQPGIYEENIDLSNNSVRFKNYRVTLASSTGNAGDVTFRPQSGVGISLNTSSKITIKDITVDVASLDVSGIELAGTCSDIEINGCTILVNPATTDSTVRGISYSNTEGSRRMITNISILNNTINGGYYNIYLHYLGYDYEANTWGMNNRIDNNTLTNAYHCGIYVYRFGHCHSISGNTLTTRAADIAQYGIYIDDNINLDTMTNNKILLQTVATTGTNSGIYMNENISYYEAKHPAIVANNEIRHLDAATTTYGITTSGVVADILHNSVYIKGTSIAYGKYIKASYRIHYLNIKNNIFSVETSHEEGYPIYVTEADHALPGYNSTTMDYNDYHSTGSYVGYIGAAMTTMSDLRTATQQDANSVNVQPIYKDASINLELMVWNDTLKCPTNGMLYGDIRGQVRPPITTMGAYTQPPTGMDLMLKAITSWDAEVIDKQTIQVYADVLNTGAVDISSATFGWSLNGVTKQTGVPWGAASSLPMFGQHNVNIGSFTVSNTVNKYTVKVWIETINGQSDTANWNDTVTASTQLVPLVEFVAPFVNGTISRLSFNVPARIRTFTGAPLSTPKMYIHTVINGLSLYDSVLMSQNGDIWTAAIPQQYYNSKVVYSLPVSDNIGNNIVLKDSVKINSTGTERYSGHNLTLSLTSPVSDINTICSPYSVPVTARIINLGSERYDFNQDTIEVGIEITDPIGNYYFITKTVDTTVLTSGSTYTVEFMSALPIMHSGTYNIKAWVSSSIDRIIYDDTSITAYISSRIDLPVRADFSTTFPIEFMTSPIQGSRTWEWYSGSANIQPDSGAGMIRFHGAAASTALLTTRQLDLYNTSNPFVEFYYYHDPNAAVDDYSYTAVNAVVDGVTTNLGTIYVHDPMGRQGWVKYRYSLNWLTFSSACVLVQFESLNKFASSAQYIDYILLHSEPDVAVSEIIITPDPALCDLLERDVLVVIKAVKNQSVTFSNTDSLILDINGTKYPVSLQGKVLQANASETLAVLSKITIPIGTTAMKAYFKTPVDNMPTNDTAKLNIAINPGFEIDIINISTDSVKTTAGFENKQGFTITNTGDVDLSNIRLTLIVDTASGKNYFTKTQTIGVNLAPGQSEEFEFTDAYTVPWKGYYDVNIYGYLVCDSAIKATASVQEKVNMKDVYLVEITSPSLATIDEVNSEVGVSVRIKNRNIGDTYNEGDVRAAIMLTDTNGTLIRSYSSEEVSAIGSGAEITFNFVGKYDVPNLSQYYLVVYIENIDEYAFNDTLKMLRTTDKVSSISDRKGISFSMEQNIPNPAKDKTVINYNIPQDGEIVFHVYSVSGQLLYIKQQNVSLGNHQIELNISDYASGIYFYTMEYKGQRIVKKMSVRR
jgi:hypothetical protein